MFKRIMVWTLLVTLINSIIGCTHMVDIRTEQSRKHEPAINRVELRPIIASVDTQDQDRILFDTSGGRFLPEKGVFVGRTLEGDSVTVKLETVRAVQEYPNFFDRSRTRALDHSLFIKVREQGPFDLYGRGRSVVDTVAPPGQRLNFIGTGGHYSLDGQRLIGQTDKGHDVEISAADVVCTWTKEKRANTVGTVLLITGSVLLVVTVLAIGAAWGEI